MSAPPDSMIERITAKLAQEFPSFAGERTPMFERGVGIKRVVERVIREMREPSNAMIEAAVLSPGDGNLGVDATNTWKAMIDAALKS